MSSRFLLPLALLAATGCAPKDTDGDGLTDDIEEDFGTNINKADTDGDGLDDLWEYRNGTDGTEWDSDGDGYGDYDEVQEGSDPTDSDDKIYAGGWPYNPDKDDMEDPGWSEDGAKKGATLPRFVMLDQWGDMVDVYDFAGHGKPVMLDVSTIWCPPCNDLAEWLDFESDYLGESYEPIREAVENGDIYWITALSQDNQGNPPDQSDLEKWYEWYPSEEIPILADNEPDENGSTELMLWLNLGYFPSVLFLDEDLVIEKFKFDVWTKALDEALEYLEDLEEDED